MREAHLRGGGRRPEDGGGARKYNRVVQVGLWQRSNAHFQKAVELVQGGLLGKVSFVRTWNYGNSYPVGQGKYPDSDPPAGLDWDFWLGPAPKVQYNFQRFGVGPNRWSTFRYFYDYANGWPGDWAVHLMDIVLWAMQTEGPKEITAIGFKRFIKDNTETPDTLEITWEFGGERLSSPPTKTASAMAIPCSSMDMELSSMALMAACSSIATALRCFRNPRSEGLTAKSPAGERARRDAAKLGKAPAIKMDRSTTECWCTWATCWIACARARRPQSDIELGHRSSSCCLLANVALRTKERLEWDVPLRAC